MKRRRPWVAFFLTQLCPGLGQLYNGDLRWAAVSFALGLALALYSTIFLFDSLAELGLALALGLLIDLGLSVQAFVRAKRIGSMELRPYQRWWAYLLFTLVLYGLPDFYGILMPSRIHSFQIPSESMVPNLLVGDRLVADGWAYWNAEPRRGDIVVFDYPQDPGTKFVKRLIGLPGDKVEVRRGVLFLNERQVPQAPLPAGSSSPHVTVLSESLDGREHTLQRVRPFNVEDYGPHTVPPGHYFMMGDNRDRSSDSRVWGFVSRDQLIGRMVYVYFSWDAQAYAAVRAEQPGDLLAALAAGLRRDRIGLKVR